MRSESRDDPPQEERGGSCEEAGLGRGGRTAGASLALARGCELLARASSRRCTHLRGSPHAPRGQPRLSSPAPWRQGGDPPCGAAAAARGKALKRGRAPPSRGRVQRPAPSQHGPRSRASHAEARRELQFPETVTSGTRLCVYWFPMGVNRAANAVSVRRARRPLPWRVAGSSKDPEAGTVTTRARRK